MSPARTRRSRSATPSLRQPRPWGTSMRLGNGLLPLTLVTPRPGPGPVARPRMDGNMDPAAGRSAATRPVSRRATSHPMPRVRMRKSSTVGKANISPR
jgi:hypothetical protein